MKKASMIMVAMTVLFCTFCGGFFLARNLSKSPVSVSAVPTTTVADTTPDSSAAKQEKVNINTATAAELMNLDGIGQVLADRIIAYRNANGSFKSLAELANVEGIGDKKLEDILDQITLGGQE